MSVKRVKPQKFPKKTSDRLWVAFIVVLAAVVLLQAKVHPHPYFKLDGEFWFYPVYGLLTSMGLVLVSKLLGTFLKRKETYWDEEEK